MPESEGSTTQLQALLDLAAKGNDDAYGELIAKASDRLLKLTRKMLRNFPHQNRWEQTDDVFQTDVLRLHQSLSEVRPNSVREFFGLATTQIRRTLIDLARHYFGPEGLGAKHETDVDVKESAGDGGGKIQHEPVTTDQPETLELWTRFHESVEALPDDEREVLSLVWYSGTTQKEAAELLQISDRTVIRRLNRARLLIKRTIVD